MGRDLVWDSICEVAGRLDRRPESLTVTVQPLARTARSARVLASWTAVEDEEPLWLTPAMDGGTSVDMLWESAEPDHELDEALRLPRRCGCGGMGGRGARAVLGARRGALRPTRHQRPERDGVDHRRGPASHRQVVIAAEALRSPRGRRTSGRVAGRPRGTRRRPPRRDRRPPPGRARQRRKDAPSLSLPLPGSRFLLGALPVVEGELLTVGDRGSWTMLAERWQRSTRPWPPTHGRSVAESDVWAAATTSDQRTSSTTVSTSLRAGPRRSPTTTRRRHREVSCAPRHPVSGVGTDHRSCPSLLRDGVRPPCV